MRGNHVLKVTAHANAPLNAHPNFRQYDFTIDGRSYFDMPKIYRLGLNDSQPSHDHGALALAQSSRMQGGYNNYSVGGGYHSQPARQSSIMRTEMPHNEAEEAAYLQQAIEESKKDAYKAPANATQPAPAPATENLIDFWSEPAPAPPAPAANTTAVTTGYNNPASYSPYAVPPQQQTPVPAPVPTPPVVNQFAVPPAAPLASSSPFAATPYAPSPYTQSPMPPATVSQPNDNPPAPYSNFAVAPPAAPVAQPAPVPEPAPAPEPAPETSGTTPQLTMTKEPTGLGANANEAYAKFANLDQFELVKPKVKAENPFDFVGTNATKAPASQTLAQMHATNGNTEKKEVMKNSNAMVMSTAQNGNWGGYSNYQYGANNMGGPTMGGMSQGQPQQQQPMMNQGYGYPQQQQYGAAPMYPQYGQQQQQQQQQPPSMQQQGYGQNTFGYGQTNF